MIGLFFGGLCFITGSYGLYYSGLNLPCLLGAIWGSFMIGYFLGRE